MTYKNRHRRIQMLDEHLQLCEQDTNARQAIMRTRRASVLYEDPLCLEQQRDFDHPIRSSDSNIRICNQRPLQIIRQLYAHGSPDRICILNPECTPYPGNRIVHGGRSDEVTRSSTLYPCLHTSVMSEAYYRRNRAQIADGGTKACIYTPDIIRLRDGEHVLSVSARDSFDVISCMLPGNWYRRYLQLTDAHECAASDTQREQMRRMEGMLSVASHHHVTMPIIALPVPDETSDWDNADLIAWVATLTQYASAFTTVIICTAGVS